MSLSSKTKYTVRKSVVVIFIVIMAATVGFFFRSRSSASGTVERLGQVVRQELVQTVTIAGTVEPIRTTVVAAPYEGYVKKIYVRQGQIVKAAEPIVSIAQSLQAAENVFPIRAPFTGTVTQLLKNEGQFVRQNDSREYIMRIDDMTKLYIYANAPEIDVVKIKTGLEAVIKASAILSRNYKGVVREISEAATTKEQWGRSQVEYLVKIEITDGDEKLKPGMTSIVDIITNKKEGVLTLAHEFIHKENDNYFVFLKDGSKKNIKVGLQNESIFEIVDGLDENQSVHQVDFLKLIENQ
ncbi:MAG: efflux RND transporter periplasmic adaptor subunit [Bdellovibrionaceae bacterium]|nr:efflux RND transporter periplasmic adaptor subunit [Pseudobdellovibrionaceae bacterium]